MSFPVELSFLGSTLGTVGFALGAVSFLSNQLGRLVLQGHEYEECADRMEDLRFVYQCCQDHLKEWDGLWGILEKSTKIYGNIWSPEKQALVRNIRMRIKDLTKQIAKDLVSPQDNWWRKNVFALSKNHPVEERYGGNIYDKVIFVLYQNAILLERTNKLKAVLQALLEHSRKWFNEHHMTRLPNDAASEDVARIVRRTIFVTDLRYFAEKLHHLRQESDIWQTCALEMWPIAEGGGVDPDTWVGIPMDIRLTMVRTEGVNEPKFTCKRVRIEFSSDTTRLNKSLGEHGASVFSKAEPSAAPEFWSLEDPAVQRSKPLSKILDEGKLREENLYRAWGQDRASLALAFATWMTLLWRAPWTSPPCCCGIRLQKIDSGRTQLSHTFTCEDQHDCEQIKQQPPAPSPSLDRSVVEEEPKMHRYLLFIGLTLAELVLATRLRIKMRTPDAVHFDYDWEIQTPESKWQPMSTAQMLMEVRKKTSFNGIASAIEYCINDLSTASIESFAGGTFQEICKKVLEPLYQYQQAISEDDKRFAATRWLRSWVTQWPPDSFFEGTVSTEMSVPGQFPGA